MLGLFRWIAKMAADHWDWVSWFFGWLWTLGGGVVTGWATWATGFFSAYAPLSWVAAGLIGAAVSGFTFWVVQKGRTISIQNALQKKWNSPGDGVNPLEDNFVRRRIMLNDFVSPANPIVEGKTFDRCEIVGPALALADSNFHNAALYDCNLVCVKDGITAYGIIVLRNNSFLNCKFYRISFLVPETAVERFFPGGPYMTRKPSEFNLPVPWQNPQPQPPAAVHEQGNADVAAHLRL